MNNVQSWIDDQFMKTIYFPAGIQSGEVFLKVQQEAHVKYPGFTFEIVNYFTDV